MSDQKRDWRNMPEVDEAAMWLKESQGGVKFLSGVVKIEGKEYTIALFKNTYKQEGSNQPDYQFSSKATQEKKKQEKQEDSTLEGVAEDSAAADF